MSNNKKILRKFLKNKGAVVSLGLLAIVVFIALIAPIIAPYRPDLVHEQMYKLPPFWSAGMMSDFLLGTDDIGRDLLSRLIYGARVSLGVGFVVVILALSMGLFLGLMAGYIGGWVDSLIMRFVDILMSLPSILLAIVVVSILGPSLINGVIAVSVVALPGFVRIVRASVMAEKEKLYVELKNLLARQPGPEVAE